MAQVTWKTSIAMFGKGWMPNIAYQCQEDSAGTEEHMADSERYDSFAVHCRTACSLHGHVSCVIKTQISTETPAVLEHSTGPHNELKYTDALALPLLCKAPHLHAFKGPAKSA